MSKKFEFISRELAYFYNFIYLLTASLLPTFIMPRDVK